MQFLIQQSGANFLAPSLLKGNGQTAEGDGSFNTLFAAIAEKAGLTDTAGVEITNLNDTSMGISMDAPSADMAVPADSDLRINEIPAAMGSTPITTSDSEAPLSEDESVDASIVIAVEDGEEIVVPVRISLRQVETAEGSDSGEKSLQLIVQPLDDTADQKTVEKAAVFLAFMLGRSAKVSDIDAVEIVVSEPVAETDVNGIATEELSGAETATIQSAPAQMANPTVSVDATVEAVSAKTVGVSQTSGDTTSGTTTAQTQLPESDTAQSNTAQTGHESFRQPAGAETTQESASVTPRETADTSLLSASKIVGEDSNSLTANETLTAALKDRTVSEKTASSDTVQENAIDAVTSDKQAHRNDVEPSAKSFDIGSADEILSTALSAESSESENTSIRLRIEIPQEAVAEKAATGTEEAADVQGGKLIDLIQALNGDKGDVEIVVTTADTAENDVTTGQGAMLSAKAVAVENAGDKPAKASETDVAESVTAKEKTTETTPVAETLKDTAAPSSDNGKTVSETTETQTAVTFGSNHERSHETSQAIDQTKPEIRIAEKDIARHDQKPVSTENNTASETSVKPDETTAAKSESVTGEDAARISVRENIETAKTSVGTKQADMTASELAVPETSDTENESAFTKVVTDRNTVSYVESETLVTQPETAGQKSEIGADEAAGLKREISAAETRKVQTVNKQERIQPAPESDSRNISAASDEQAAVSSDSTENSSIADTSQRLKTVLSDTKISDTGQTVQTTDEPDADDRNVSVSKAVPVSRVRSEFAKKAAVVSAEKAVETSNGAAEKQLSEPVNETQSATVENTLSKTDLRPEGKVIQSDLQAAEADVNSPNTDRSGTTRTSVSDGIVSEPVTMSSLKTAENQAVSDASEMADTSTQSYKGADVAVTTKASAQPGVAEKSSQATEDAAPFAENTKPENGSNGNVKERIFVNSLQRESMVRANIRNAETSSTETRESIPASTQNTVSSAGEMETVQAPVSTVPNTSDHVKADTVSGQGLETTNASAAKAVATDTEISVPESSTAQETNDSSAYSTTVKTGVSANTTRPEIMRSEFAEAESANPEVQVDTPVSKTTVTTEQAVSAEMNSDSAMTVHTEETAQTAGITAAANNRTLSSEGKKKASPAEKAGEEAPVQSARTQTQVTAAQNSDFGAMNGESFGSSDNGESLNWQTDGADSMSGDITADNDTAAATTVQNDFSRIIRTASSGTEKAQSSAMSAEYEERVFSSVVSQAKFMIGRGSSNAVITLDPPSLGKVRLELVTEQSKVTGRITVESKEVKEVIENRMSELSDSLSKSGLKVESFDVQVGHNSGTDSWARREDTERMMSQIRQDLRNGQSVSDNNNAGESAVLSRARMIAHEGAIDLTV